jgi:hypothetical protein
MDENFSVEILAFVFAVVVLIVLYYIGEGMGWLNPDQSILDFLAELANQSYVWMRALITSQ